ncbi:MAG: hypothetical protein ACE5IZ_09520 [Dehalococcoidia bacterium]
MSTGPAGLGKLERLEPGRPALASLAELERLDPVHSALARLAVYIGATRLIDNVALGA